MFRKKLLQMRFESFFSELDKIRTKRALKKKRKAAAVEDDAEFCPYYLDPSNLRQNL